MPNLIIWSYDFLLSHKINKLQTPEKIFEAAKKNRLVITIVSHVKTYAIGESTFFEFCSLLWNGKFVILLPPKRI